MPKLVQNQTKVSAILSLGLLFMISMFSHHLYDELNISGIEKSSTVYKQKGTHVFGRLDTTNLKNLEQTNFDWITVVTWGYQDDIDGVEIRHDNATDSLKLLQIGQDLINKINAAHEGGFKVFFKPHLWISYASNGKWRSDVYPTNEENWLEWAENYRSFIKKCALIAEQTQVEMFCIGTELTKLSLGKPLYWKSLITEIRQIYSGKLTYAANWYREYEEISFWDELDYVGIQAYFPLSDKMNPSTNHISDGWNRYIKSMETIQNKYNKQIIFTELGYKSTADSAIEPWKWLEHAKVEERHYSLETQSNCYKAFFNSVWNKPWFGGVHIWQWSTYKRNPSIKKDLNFTPQGKPAEHIIAEAFAQNNKSDIAGK